MTSLVEASIIERKKKRRSQVVQSKLNVARATAIRAEEESKETWEVVKVEREKAKVARAAMRAAEKAEKAARLRITVTREIARTAWAEVRAEARETMKMRAAEK